jgi:hypothetical protein
VITFISIVLASVLLALLSGVAALCFSKDRRIRKSAIAAIIVSFLFSSLITMVFWPQIFPAWQTTLNPNVSPDGQTGLGGALITFAIVLCSNALAFIAFALAYFTNKPH